MDELGRGIHAEFHVIHESEDAGAEFRLKVVGSRSDHRGSRLGFHEAS